MTMHFRIRSKQKVYIGIIVPMQSVKEVKTT